MVNGVFISFSLAITNLKFNLYFDVLSVMGVEWCTSDVSQSQEVIVGVSWNVSSLMKGTTIQLLPLLVLLLLSLLLPLDL